MPEAVPSIEPTGNIMLAPGTLRSFAAVIEQFPFPDNTIFGAIGKKERPVALGYTPKQLVGVLHRLDSELAKGNEKLFDKAHWQLASMEAMRAMSGPLAGSAQEAFDTQIGILREQVTRQRMGPEYPTQIVRKQIHEIPVVPKDQTIVGQKIRKSLAEAFLEHAREFTRAHKNPRVWMSEAILVATAACSNGGIIPTQEVSPNITPPAITQTVPGLETPSPTDFQVTPTDVYHFGSGGPISIERLLEMERQDPTVVKQIAWLNAWGDWYGSADPSIRPMTSEEARTDIVFYEWTGTDGSVHYKVAWKFDAAGYQGYILVPPAINWEGLNPPVAAPAGHEIGPGQGPVKISIECLEGSDLAKLGVPVGAKLAPEQGSGDWVMVFNDQVAARIDETGVWQLEAPNVIFGLAATAEEVPDLGSMDKLIAAAKYFAAQPRVIASDQIAQMGVAEQPDVSEVQIFCNPGGLKNCAILATTRVADHYYLIVQIGTEGGPKNLLLYLGSSHLAYEYSGVRASIEALNNYVNSFSLKVYTRVKLAGYDNPEIYRLTVGPTDPLPDSFQRLGEGEITDELEITPVWAAIQ